METISIRFEKDFVEDIKRIMKGHRYATKTEFIREAVRDKIEDIEKQEALIQLEKIYGARANKRNITDARLHKVRQQAAEEIAKELGIKVK